MQSRFFGGPILIAFFELTAAAGQSERKPATGPRPVRQSLPILSAEISPGIIFSAGLLISNSDSRKTRPPRHKPPEESETAPAGRGRLHPGCGTVRTDWAGSAIQE